MDQVQDFIIKARSQGQTDDQIKQVFLTKGWSIEQLAPYFSPSVPSGNFSSVSTIQKKNQTKYVLMFIVLALLCFAGSIAWNLFQKKSKPDSTPLPSQSNVIPTNSPKPTFSPQLVVFLKLNEALTKVGDTNLNLAEVYVYDLTQKKLLPPDQLLSAEKKTLPSLGPWSPDGKLAPILMGGGINEPHPLYFYDSTSEKTKKVYEFTPQDVQKYVGFSTSFWFMSKWLDDSHFIFYTQSGPQGSVVDYYTITIDGVIEKHTEENKYKVANNNLSFELDATSASPSGTFVAKNIREESRLMTFIPTGNVIGLIGKQLVSLEIPKTSSMIELSSDPTFMQKLQGASEAESQKIMEEYLKPTGETKLHFYETFQGKELKTHTLQSDGWITTEAQIRPTRHSIIIAQKDKSLPPYTKRFLEINPDNLSNKFIAQTALLTNEPKLTMSTLDTTFSISNDGVWLLTYDSPSGALDAAINSWNIDSGEKQVVCEKLCSFLKVYNSEQLVRR